MDAVGTSVCGHKITEGLYSGAWDVCRAQGPDGRNSIITIVRTSRPPPERLTELALEFPGIPQLLAAEPLGEGLAIIEREPEGWSLSALKWPLPIDEVITVGLDLARLLERMHAAGVVHGSLRPQTTWIKGSDTRCSLTGTTPRPELIGLPGAPSPFAGDEFASDAPRGPASDVAQLCMLLHRMALHTSPPRGSIPAWNNDDPRARALEDLARTAFTTRELAPLLAGLEKL
jgi:hypothetical protein